VTATADGSVEKDLGKKVADLINKSITNINITESEISVCHRIGRSVQVPGAVGTTRHQPIVVRFTRRAVRNDILWQRKQLKGTRIFITEQLTPQRSLLLKRASELVASHKLDAAWSHDGRILVKTIPGRIQPIITECDFSQFCD